MQLYDDSRARVVSPNEAEFRAYCVIFQIQNSIPDLEDRVQTWPSNVANHPRVQRALRLYAAATNTADAQGPLKPRIAHPIAQAHWRRFWSLVKSKETSYLMACVAEIYFSLVRRTALNAIWQSYRASSTRKMEDWTLDDLIEVFGFETEEQVQDFCISYGFTIAQRGDGIPYLDLNSVSGRSLPDPPAGSHAQRKSEFVEQKRLGRALSAVINGLSVHAAQAAGLVDPTTQLDVHTRRPSSGEGKSLFITDESDDERAPLTSTTQSSFGKPSTFNPFASSFVPTAAPPPLQSQNTGFTSTFGSNTTKPGPVSTPDPTSFSLEAHTNATSPFSIKPGTGFTFGSTQINPATFGASTTNDTATTISPFAQAPASNQVQAQSSPKSESQAFPKQESKPTSPFTSKPLPTFNFGACGTTTTVQTSPTPNPPFSKIRQSTADNQPGSSPVTSFTKQTPSFSWPTADSVNATTSATASAPSFTFPSITSAAQVPPAQPPLTKLAPPTFTFGQPTTATPPQAFPSSELNPQTSTSGSQFSTTHQAPSSTFGLPPTSSQPQPIPIASGPSQEELLRIAHVKEASKARKSVLLDQVARALMIEKYGFLEQFVEYTAMSLIHKARQQVIDEKADMRAGQ